MKFSTELVESFKEGLRTFIGGELWTIVAVLGVIIAGINKELGTFLIQWNVALAILVADTAINLRTAISSAADKWLHEKDVRTVLDLRGLDTLKE